MDNSKKFLKEIVKFDSKTRKYRYIYFGSTLFLSLADTLLAFSIPFATESFKKGHHKLAIGFLTLTILNQLIFSIMRVFDRKFDMKYDMYNDIDSSQKTVEILGVVRNKVYVTEDRMRRRLNTVEIKENTKNYISKTRLLKDQIIYNITQMVIFIGMFTGTIATTRLMVKNTTSLIVIMSVCVVAITLVTIRQIKRRELFYKERRKLYDVLNRQKMDILNVSPLNQKHQNFLTDNYIKSSKEIELKTIKITIKEKIEECYKSGVMSISIIILLFISIFSYDSLDIGIFASLMALSTLYHRLLQTLTHEISSIQHLIDTSSDKKSYDTIMNIISEKYVELMAEKSEGPGKINYVELINLDFIHEDKQNKTTHRIVADKLIFQTGNCTLIYGESGSGKSTLLKILAGIYSYDENNVIINNKYKKKSLSNFIMYDPDSNLGNKSILEEVTLENEKTLVNKERLIEILKGLCLYETIITKARHEPIIDYMSSVFQDTFSAGQIQRFVLARLLYNLDQTIDVVILDEPVANLDDVTASNVVKFIKDYCNQDTSRIILIASHQVKIVEKFCGTKYNFKDVSENYFQIQSI